MKLTPFISTVALAIMLPLRVGGQPAQINSVVTRLPLIGDETSVTALLANPQKFLERQIVICGVVAVGNYYNFGYGDSSATHFSLRFVQATKDMRPAGKLTVYARRNMAGKLVDEILRVQEREPRASKIVRLKVMVTSLSFSQYDGSFGEAVELVDWQFLTPDLSGWGAWAQEKVPRPVHVMTPSEKAQVEAEKAAAKKSIQDKALKWNQEQADKGDAFGLLRMGERYRDGDGVPKDLAKARQYFTKAVAAGAPDADKALSKLNQVSTNFPATK